MTTRKPSTVGDILRYEFIEPAGLRIDDFAQRLNVQRNTISALISNNRTLTAEVAFRLANAFETSADFWLNLQKNVVWEVQNTSRLMAEIDNRVTVKTFFKRPGTPL